MPVSSSVEAGLVSSLQGEIGGLRDENRELCQGLREAEQAHADAAANVVTLEEENARLKRALERAEKKAASTTAEAAPSVVGAEDLEREIVAALTEALGAQSDGSAWENAAGASRRRATKTSSSIVTAAVKTAKRAQAAWAAEHAKLRDEDMQAQRAEASRVAELEEAQSVIRRLKSEINSMGRRLELQRQELQRSEANRRLEPLPPPPPPPPPLSSEPIADHSSAFTAFMEAKKNKQNLQQQLQQPRSMGSLMPAAESQKGRTRLPRLPVPLPAAARALKDAGTLPTDHAVENAEQATRALRSMTEALQHKWQRHVTEQNGPRSLLPRAR